MKVAFEGRKLLPGKITGPLRLTRELLSRLEKIIPFENLRVFEPKKGYGRIQSHFWEHFFLPIEIQKWKPDILFCPVNIAPIFKPKGVKVVTCIHDLSYHYFPEAYSLPFNIYYRIIIPYVMWISDAIIVLSHTDKKATLARFPKIERKLYVATSGISQEFYRESNVKREPFFLYVGSLSKRKNFQGVVRAFVQIMDQVPHSLVLIGSGGEIFSSIDETMKRFIAKIPSERIHFVGHVNNMDELRLWYSRADAFIFPSFFESVGLPPLEAMACGCPTVVSNIPTHQEVCSDATLYCDPYSIDDIAQKMKRITLDTTLRECLIDAGKSRAAFFTWENMAEKVYGVFEAVLAKEGNNT